MNYKEELEKKIGYTFRDDSLLLTALTHSSYANESKRYGKKAVIHNERLEFLGDAVLELASSQFLFRNYKELPEGALTKLRASLVCEQTLALCAREIQLGDYIRLGKGEELTGGRHKDSVTSDAFEALIGAIYLDGGMQPATRFVETFVMNDIEHKKLYVDCKTNLQELVQRDYPDQSLHYELIGEEGPDHNKFFSVKCMIGDQVVGHGKARTKKNAQQQAAYEAVRMLKDTKLKF